MGACCGDLFRMLLEKYGQEFVTLIVAQKGKVIVKEEFANAKKEFDKVFGDAIKHVTTVVDSKTSELTKVYETEKSKVSSGTIQDLEKITGKSLDDLSGFNTIKGDIDNLKKDSLGKMETEKATIEGAMTTAESDLITKIENDRPKLPLYEDCPVSIRDSLMKKGEKKFASEMAANKDKIVTDITGKFGPAQLQNSMGKFNPSKQLNSIVGGASSTFSKALGGNPLSGGLGSIF